MSCTTLRPLLLDSVRAQATGNIAKAKANIEVYLHNPVGIGEHSDVLSSIQVQLDVIAEESERIEVINKHFTTHNHKQLPNY